MFARVIVDISLEKLDRTYTYSVPQSLLEAACVGANVVVPFGNGNRRTSGYIIELCEEAGFDESRIKPILEVSGKGTVIKRDMILLASRMKELSGATMNDCLKTVLPVKAVVKEKQYRTIKRTADRDTVADALVKARWKNHVAKERVLEELVDCDTLDYDLVVSKLNVSASTLRALERAGIIEIVEKQLFRDPAAFLRSETNRYGRTTLNETQKMIAKSICDDLDNNEYRPYLIHGVTGSGKTEVYLEVIEHVAASGGQCIMLIPEISLTYQTVMRFIARFGDRVSFLNSKMSAGERYDQSQRAKRGELDVMIGPRSALFTPFDRLKLIIIDEEHEDSYRNEGIPHYDARQMAIERGRICGAGVVLGSATPSVDSFTKAKRGEYGCFEMRERAGGASKPSITCVDMREELKSGNRSIFSSLLREKIDDRLEKGQQTMLFINRRGYAGFISCRSCGYVVKCPHCDVSLTKHSNGKLMCHYCGYEMPSTDVCPSCHSKAIGAFGLGTQKVEEQIMALFPKAKVLRMDADTVKGKNGHEDILSAFSNGGADILIGTQMIVKGHDFHNVTLVGVVAADLSLHAPDYKAAERTYELLAQAAGRAGRGKLAGEVVIQTYNPEHYSIQAAVNDDYDAFFEQESDFRQMMEYPPESNLLMVLCQGRTPKHAEDGARRLAMCAKCFVSETKSKSCRILGPQPAAIEKLNDIYRQVIYIKEKDVRCLIELRNALSDAVKKQDFPSGCLVQFDFNPIRTL